MGIGMFTDLRPHLCLPSETCLGSPANLVFKGEFLDSVVVGRGQRLDLRKVTPSVDSITG
jgi:hypothetical protein